MKNYLANSHKIECGKSSARFFNNWLIFFLLIFILILGSWAIWQKKIKLNSGLLNQAKHIFQKSPVICEKCNVLLIDIDLLRADELPCNGYRRNTTPNLCAFADKALVYDNNFSASIWTLPGTFSTITSRYSMFHRVRTAYVDKLDSSIPTLAETLTNNGYTSLMVSEYKGAYIQSQINGGDRGYQRYTSEPLDQVITEASLNSQPWFIHFYTEYLHSPYLFPSRDIQFIEDLPKQKNLILTQDEFVIALNSFLKKNYLEVFRPSAIKQYAYVFFAPNDPKDLRVISLFYYFLEHGIETDNLFFAENAVTQTHMGSYDQQDPADIAYIRMLYDTKLKLLDEQLAPIFQLVDNETYKNNTIILVYSDHGEAFGEHGTLFHVENYHTEQFATPLMIYVPGYDKQHIAQTSSNMDIFPTLIEFLGLKPIASLQGRSLAPYASGKLAELNSFVETEAYGSIVWQNHDWLYWLPKESKNILDSVLYDKINDPLETTNVAQKNPELTKLLFDRSELLYSYQELF